MNRNILITSAGRRVSLVRIFQNELRKLLKGSLVYASDANLKYSAACKIADESFELPRNDSESYIRVLLAKCIENNIQLVIPTIDTELKLLSKNVESFSKNNIQIVISDMELVEKCRDKFLIHDWFEKFQVPVANVYNESNYKLPLFTKPKDGSRSVGANIVYTEGELKRYNFKDTDRMFLEYIDSSNFDEYTCDLYYGRDNMLKCIVPRKRIEVRDGEVSKGVTKNNVLVNFIKERLKKVEGARGCITAQFFLSKDQKQIVGIEINPRFGGGYPLSYHAGANYPKWIIQEYLLDEKISYFESWKDNLLMLRYDDEIIVNNDNF